jgi:hypothetical protein
VKWTNLEEVLSMARKVGNLCFAHREMTGSRAEECKNELCEKGLSSLSFTSFGEHADNRTNRKSCYVMLQFCV